LVSGFSLLRTATEFARHGRTAIAEHGNQERVGIELTLMGGTKDAREDLLGGGTVPGPIAAAHFARDHNDPFILPASVTPERFIIPGIR
jgi:hypothetical protein